MKYDAYCDLINKFVSDFVNENLNKKNTERKSICDLISNYHSIDLNSVL